MTNLDSILKCRVITVSTKVHLVKAMVFPVVKYGCENWTIKKADCWRIHAFELWCCRRLLRVTWTVRRSNQSLLKEIRPGCSLGGLMLTLKFQYFGPWCEELTHLKRPWCWERLKVGVKGANRGRDGWMASLTQWMWVWVNSGSWWWTGKPGMLQSMGSQGVRHDWATELNWAEPETWLQTEQSSYRLCEDTVKLVVCKPREKVSNETKLATLDPRPSNQNWEKTKFYC